MINTLQLIVHLPLFAISFPAVTLDFYSILVNIVTFSIVPLTNIDAWVLDQDPNSYVPFNDRFNFLGYSSTNTI
jgi:hypothetical protein